MAELQALGVTEYRADTVRCPPSTGQYVSKAEYWEKHYHNSETIYEWNNGQLEEKPVSDFITILMYDWFSELLGYFLKSHPIAQKTVLEMGFHLGLSQTNEVRRPDLGIVLNSNPVQLELTDKSYQGIFDICIEALSDSSKADIERDTVDKKKDYAAAGVKEYYILDGHNRHTQFYRLNARGIYQPIKSNQEGLIKSKVLPGFQFRRSDLSSRPTLEEMIDDSVYQGFVLPDYAESKMRAEQAEQRAEQEQQRAERLAQQLRDLGITPND